MARRWSALLVGIVLIVGQAGTSLAGPSGPAGESAVAAARIQKGLAEKVEAGEVTRFVVEFAARGDLRPAARLKDKAAKARAVLDSLTATATRSQGKAKGLVRATKGASARSYWLTNVLIVDASGPSGAKLLGRLAALDEVSAVRAEKVYPRVEPVPLKDAPIGPADHGAIGTPEWGIAKINADHAWADGVTGSGIVVANIDTGVDYTHPALVGNYRGNNGDGSFTHDYNWWDPTGICGAEPCDNDAHGTHTMGTIAGGDGPGPFEPDIGVAPGATWIAAKGCEDFGCSEEALVSSGQFVVAPTDLNGENPDPTKHPDIVSNSWGGGPGDSFYLEVVQAWRTAGIIPVFAAGNAGPECGSGGSPGDYLEVFSVGATDIDDEIAGFSSRGPSTFGKINPDVSAPGVNVLSSIPGGGFDAFSGTSMATPHVAGALALVMQAAPELIGDYDGVTGMLRSTAVDRIDESCGGDEDGDPNNVFGDGRIDAGAAVDLAATGGTLSGTVTDAETAAPVPGARISADNGAREFTTTADASGNYEVFLGADEYTVSASGFGYETAAALGVVIVTDETTDQDFALTPLPRFTVSGQVTSAENGSPIEGAKVRAVGTPVAPAVTNPNGVYRLELPIGTYVMRATHGGCANPEQAGVTGSVEDEVVDQDFALERKLDDFGHACEPIAFDWVDAANQTSLFGDDFFGRLLLPFPFEFYGETYTRAFPATNGYLSFTQPSDFFSPFVAEPIPSSSEPNAAIYVNWRDFVVIDDESVVKYDTIGTTPDRTFVLEYERLRVFGGDARVDMEIKLHENGSIDLVWGDLPSTLRGSRATVGLENASGRDAFQYLFDESLLDPFSAVRFSIVPSGLVTGTVTDANDGQPIAGATITATPSGRHVATGVDGTYSLRLLPGDYTLEATAGTYTPDSATVNVVVDETDVVDFSLTAPVGSVEPTEVVASVGFGDTTTADVTLSNSGSATLLWGARERDLGATLPDLPPLAAGVKRSAPTYRGIKIPAGTPRAAVRPVAFESLPIVADDPDDDSSGRVENTEIRGQSDGAQTSIALIYADGSPLTELGGYVYLDVDQDPSTGLPPEAFFGKPTQDIGFDYWAELFAVGADDPEIAVFNLDGDLVAVVPATRTDTLVGFSIPLDALGGDDGNIDIALDNGTAGPEDWVPDEGHGTVEAFAELDWIGESPIGGEVAMGDSQVVTLTLGSETLPPGEYHGQVVFVSNAPKGAPPTVDVTLTVELPEEFGTLTGTVTDSHTGEPIAGAAVTIDATWQGNPLPLADVTADDGTWSVTGPEGTWAAMFSADGYVPDGRNVTITRAVTTGGVDAALHRVQPHAALDGGPFTFVLTPGRQGHGTLTLSNPDGHAPLDFQVGEVDLGSATGAGVETWLTAGPARASGSRSNRTGATPNPRAYRWLPSPADTASVLVYADDVVHTAPDTLVDQALQRLGIGYVAHYDGDWGGFEDDLSAGTWDMVIVAADNFGPDTSTLDLLEAYVSGGGRLLYHNWAVLAEPEHPLMTALGVQFASNDDDPPDPVYWWQPGHPAVLVPQEVPELTALDGGLFNFSYGQHVEPLAGTDTVAGYTSPGPDPNEAALVIRETGNTVFKGFTDSQNSADLDEDGLLDGSELWENLIFGIQNGFLSDAPWLTVTPADGTVGVDGSAAIDVAVDSTGLAPGVYNALVVVRTNDPDNRSSRVPVTLIVPGYQQGINAGGGSYTNANGDIYAADQVFSAGSFGYLGASSSRSTGSPIDGTTEDPLYQDQRTGMSEYRFEGLAAGTYRIDLQFAEIQLNRANARVFGVTIEGASVLSNFDVFAAGGRNTAVDRSFFVEVTDGTLDIVFAAQRGDKPIVNAILVTHMPEGSPGL